MMHADIMRWKLVKYSTAFRRSPVNEAVWCTHFMAVAEKVPALGRLHPSSGIVAPRRNDYCCFMGLGVRVLQVQLTP